MTDRPFSATLRGTMKDQFSRVIHRAWLRDGDKTHTGEALLIACLLHAKGEGRESRDMEDVRRIMRDANVEKEKNEVRDHSRTKANR